MSIHQQVVSRHERKLVAKQKMSPLRMSDGSPTLVHYTKP